MSEQIAGRLRSVAGVRSVSWAMLIPLGNDLRGERFAVAGGSDRGPRTYVNSVAPGYFETMRIPLLRGRDFSINDRPGAPTVVIVSETFARSHFPGDEALGKLDRHSPTEDRRRSSAWSRTMPIRIAAAAPEPVLYRAYAQIPNMSTQPRPLIIHVRTEQPAEASLAAIRSAMGEFEPNGPALVEPLRDATSQELVMRRVMGFVLSSVGVLGLILATIGLYGVMAFVVTSRTPKSQFKWRSARHPLTCAGACCGGGLKLVLLGVIIGTVFALAATRPLAAMLAGLSPSDPVDLRGNGPRTHRRRTGGELLPARRATRVDPMAALRQQ